MPTSSAAMPPCIVLGLETQIGLSLIRELGRAGVPVIGIAQDAEAIGLASRYLFRGVVVESPRSAELIKVVRAIGEEFGPCCLLAVSEANLVWLAENRTALGCVRPVLPTAESLTVVLDKQLTLQAAREIGIPVPETVQPRSMADACALATTFKFPAVLKWSDPNTVAKKLRLHGLDLIKAEYVYSAEQFLAIARRYGSVGEWPIMQSYCPGLGLGQFFYMHQGQALQRFQHLRIAEWPPEGGFSSVCDGVPLDQHRALQEKSIALLRHIGWDGVAMVEYRWNPETGQAVLMEINGRFWGSYPLALHSQANFGLISYYLASRLPLPSLPAPRHGIRCRMVATELKRLERILRHPELIADKSFPVRRLAELWRFLTDFFRPNVRYYVWSVMDPKPFLADLRNLLRKFKGTA